MSTTDVIIAVITAEGIVQTTSVRLGEDARVGFDFVYHLPTNVAPAGLNYEAAFDILRDWIAMKARDRSGDSTPIHNDPGHHTPTTGAIHDASGEESQDGEVGDTNGCPSPPGEEPGSETIYESESEHESDSETMHESDSEHESESDSETPDDGSSHVESSSNPLDSRASDEDDGHIQHPGQDLGLGAPDDEDDELSLVNPRNAGRYEGDSRAGISIRNS